MNLDAFWHGLTDGLNWIISIAVSFLFGVGVDLVQSRAAEPRLLLTNSGRASQPVAVRAARHGTEQQGARTV